jgi:Alpha/beta hydrolase
VVTYEELRAADPAPYQRAADVWRAAAKTVRDQAGDLVTARTRLGDAWPDGDAADAGWERTTNLVSRLDAINAALMSLDQVLSTHASGITHAKNLLEDGLDLAGRYGVAINADGTVDIPRQGGQVQASMIGIVDEISARIDTAVQYANDLDTTTAADLYALFPSVAESMTVVDLSSVPRPGSDPAAVKEWWDGLTFAQQRWLIENDPAAIGRLDGIPADARDQANRILLEESKRDLEAQKRDLQSRMDALADPANADPSQPNPLGAAMAERKRLQAQLDVINGKLQGIDAVDHRMSTEDGAEGRGYLLLFDTDGNGHAVVATGNPDTAANIVTYVPGTGAKLGDMRGFMSRADLMAATADGYNPAVPTVGVVWLGYDAPADIVPNAMNVDYANHASADLSRFQDGLRVTHVGVNHDGAPSHNTVLGHSYGSVVVGVAQRNGGLHADDLIFVGSPGVGVDNVSDLHMSGSHVWSSHTGNDPILGAKNMRDTVVAGSASAVVPGALVGAFGSDHLLYGTNPDSPNFGGQNFASQDGTPGVQAHSDYWNLNSPSLSNMAHIIAGQPDQVAHG